MEKEDPLVELSTSNESSGDNRLRDAVLALQALGQSAEASAKKVKAVAEDLTPKMSVEDIIRKALTQ